jgi:ParB family chromosome partitioning protein
LTGTVQDIDISNISLPGNILRTTIDTTDLIDSIYQYGLLQPLIVRCIDDHFEIVAGYRRFIACSKLGWKKISCHVAELDDKTAFEVALIENLSRNSLNPVEEAQAFRKYISDYGWGGIADLADRISRSSSYISKRMRLLELAPDVQELLTHSDIYPSVAEELLSVEGIEKQSELAIIVKENDLTLRVTRSLMRDCLNVNKDLSEDLKANEFSSRSYDYNSYDVRKYFDKLIVSLRLALKDTADLIDEVENSWVLREILLQHRNMINAQIDILIRQKKKSK